MIRWAAFAVWVAFEFALIAREQKLSRGGESDDSTRWPIFISVSVGAAAAWVLSFLESGTLQNARYYTPIGASLMLSGIAFRWWAVQSLGRHFRLAVTIDREHTLVTAGPYRILRHPSYTGTLVTLAGWAISFGTLFGLGAALLIALPSLVRRMKVEENALRSALGDEYLSYLRRTHRIVPGIW